jgi:hypothetical protein
MMLPLWLIQPFWFSIASPYSALAFRGRRQELVALALHGG